MSVGSWAHEQHTAAERTDSSRYCPWEHILGNKLSVSKKLKFQHLENCLTEMFICSHGQETHTNQIKRYSFTLQAHSRCEVPQTAKAWLLSRTRLVLKYLYYVYLNGRCKVKKTPTIRPHCPKRPPGMWGGHLPSWSWNRWNGYSLCRRCPACLSSPGWSCGHTAGCASHWQPPGWTQKTVASEHGNELTPYNYLLTGQHLPQASSPTPRK